MSETSYTLPPAPDGIDAQLGPGRPTPGRYRDGASGEPPRLVITFSRGLLDRVRIVGQRELKVSHGLLPWPGAGPFGLDEIESFAIRRDRDLVVTAQVQGREERLVGRIAQSDQAEYIHDALGAWLEAARR